MNSYLPLFPIVGIALLFAAPAEVAVAPGWTAIANDHYQAGIDRKAAHSGHSSIFLKCITPDSQGYAARQRIRADAYRGKRIRLTGWLKTDQAQSGGALWLRIDMQNGDYILDGMFEMRGKDWTRVQIVAPVPADAVGISFGPRMIGQGEVWVDDLTFEIVPDKTPTNTIERRKNKAGLEGKEEFAKAPSRPINLDFEN